MTEYHAELVANFGMKIITIIFVALLSLKTQEQVSKPFTIEAKL